MKEHLTIVSQFDNLPLDVIVMSAAHPKGIIQISHGMCEHKERYLDFMDFLVQNDYICIIHDHRGHGKSILSDDDLGYFYENGHIGIIEDLHQVSLFIKERYPSLPLYLFGHSMGSMVVRCYTQKYDQDIQGLIVCGSPSQNPAASIGLRLSSWLSHRKGHHHRSDFIQNIAFGAFNKRFDTNTPNSWICSDKDVVSVYNQNPLCQYVFTTNGFQSLFQLMLKTYSSKDWIFKHPNLPIHFIAGYDDPCIVNEKKFNQAVDFMKNIGYINVSSYLFQGMRHEILNEKNKHIVYQHILETIKSWE
ncbi:MAG: alpha/beta fold hydrolase [Coprobacillus sp.]